jgi:phosphorylcholine metabolism protein LicD
MKLLSNGSKYKICNVEHTIRDNLIIKKPIPMTDLYKLERLYKVIKYTTEFLDEHEIDYCIEGGTLIGCVRHGGIIPWDNDVDIMIFKDGYNKMKTIMDKYTNEKFTILHMTPGFKLFYEEETYGELFVYDYDENEDLYRMSFPYIYQNGSYKPTFITSDIYYSYARYRIETLFPTKKTLFEDFYVRTPNDIMTVLSTIYKSNLLNCVFSADKNMQYESMKLSNYKFAHFLESIFCNKFFLFIYIFLHWLVNKFAISI